jgi:hypothetical protein
MQSIVPRPLFAEAASMALQQEEYYLLQPSVFKYLSEFSHRLNVERDFKWARVFLAKHNLAPGTYCNYRGFIERLLLWSWIYCGKSTLSLNRKDFGEFVSFNQSPPADWIGVGVRRRFMKNGEAWIFNCDWRPFDARSLKSKDENIGSYGTASYKPFSGSLRQLLSICSSFYNFLHAEGAATVNPVVAIRPQGFRNMQRSDHPAARCLTPIQWSYVIRAAERMANRDRGGERALFILATTYFMYLRASDLSSDEGAFHTMGEFILRDDQWWLELEHPRRPTARILVNPEFLPYLTRYRKSRGLPPLPFVGETSPLLQTVHERPGLTTRRISAIVKPIFTQAHQDMNDAGEASAECANLLSASLNSLRETSAMAGTETRSPPDLQRDLRSVSLSYTYGKYYRRK